MNLRNAREVFFVGPRWQLWSFSPRLEYEFNSAVCMRARRDDRCVNYRLVVGALLVQSESNFFSARQNNIEQRINLPDVWLARGIDPKTSPVVRAADQFGIHDLQ